MFTFLFLTALTLLGFALMALIAEMPTSRNEVWRKINRWSTAHHDRVGFYYEVAYEYGITRKHWHESIQGRPGIDIDLAFLKFLVGSRLTRFEGRMLYAVTRMVGRIDTKITARKRRSAGLDQVLSPYTVSPRAHMVDGEIRYTR